ncbi:MAG: type II secretion system F family protein [Gammaproteobacteria bacterium]|nr:type II secretion system F family protein [Gammaproteobacteria bacterium]
MAVFQYKGRNSQGESVSGELEANSTNDAASHLINIGITPIDIIAAQVKQAGPFDTFQELFDNPIPDANELIMFSRQMATLLKAGISLLPTLQGLQTHMTHKGMHKAVGEIASDIEAGRSLAGSMQKHPKIFSTLFVSMMSVGENTGQLDQAFQHIYRYLEIDKETKDRVKEALRYPSFVIIAMAIAIGIINLMVIPQFARVFESFGSELPWATKILMATSQFTVNYWQYILVGLVITFMRIKAYINTEEGKYKWDRQKLRLPLVGNIINRATLARFSRAFSMAFRAGVPITQTLVIVSRAVDNSYIEQRILSMRDGLEHGESLTQTAVASNLFTPLVLQMINVGEETGAVDDMLDEVANFYEREVEYDTKKLSSAIEPIMITVIGIMVLILALGVFLPMWDLGSAAMGR